MGEDLQERLRGLRAFLSGEGPLHGKWFADDTAHRYWWRASLHRIDKAADEIARLKGENADLARKLEAQKRFAGSIGWTAAEAQEALVSNRAFIEEMVEGLKPFATFADNNVDEEGWSNPASGCQKERVVDWFGPSDFRRARSLLTKAAGGMGMPAPLTADSPPS